MSRLLLRLSVEVEHDGTFDPISTRERYLRALKPAVAALVQCNPHVLEHGARVLTASARNLELPADVEVVL